MTTPIELNDLSTKVSKILDVDKDDVKNILQKLSIGDYVAVLQATRKNDTDEIKDIMNNKVKEYFNNKRKDNKEVDSLVETCNYFGLSVDTIRKFLGLTEKYNNEFDKQVSEAQVNISFAKLGKRNGNIISELNQFQRRELLSLIDPYIQYEIERIVSMSPNEILAAHAKLLGYDVPELNSKESLNEMMEDILFHAINQDLPKDTKNIKMSIPLGSLELEEEKPKKKKLKDYIKNISDKE